MGASLALLLTGGGSVTGPADAAAEIGRLVNHILALAPDAGLYVSIKIEPRQNAQHSLADGDRVPVAGDGLNLFHGSAN